jgi:hypothetical protein
MSLQLSTGLRCQLLDTAAFRTIFNLSFIRIYSGTPPVTADAVLANTLLLSITNNNTATGLTFAAAAANGAITKTVAEVWSGTCGSTGTASFYRLVTSTDTGNASTTQPRLQGLCGTAGNELNLPTLSLVNTTLYTVDNYSIGIPTL